MNSSLYMYVSLNWPIYVFSFAGFFMLVYQHGIIDKTRSYTYVERVVANLFFEEPKLASESVLAADFNAGG